MTDFFVGYGTREGRIYKLDAHGIPVTTSTTAYVGTKIKGLSGFASTNTNVRRIQHYDGDSVSLVQIFPTLDVTSGTITVDGHDMALSAILGNTKETTHDSIKVLPMMSDQQGSEPSVALIVTQAAKTDEGADGFHMQLINSTQAVPASGSFGNNNYETTYACSPSRTSHHMWGLDYTTADDGTEAAALDDAFAAKKAIITVWLSDGTTSDLTFDTNYKAIDTSYKVYQNDGGTVTELTTGVTKAVDKVSFSTGNIPANGKTVLVLHTVA
jgi:hypothetical protein